MASFEWVLLHVVDCCSTGWIVGGRAGLRRDTGAFGTQVTSKLSVGLGVGIVIVNNHDRGGFGGRPVGVQ